MTESHYQEHPSDHPFAGVDMALSRPREESVSEMNLRLDNERLRRTNRANTRAIFNMAEEIRGLRAVIKATK